MWNCLKSSIKSYFYSKVENVPHESDNPIAGAFFLTYFALVNYLWNIGAVDILMSQVLTASDSVVSEYSPHIQASCTCFNTLLMRISAYVGCF